MTMLHIRVGLGLVKVAVRVRAMGMVSVMVRVMARGVARVRVWVMARVMARVGARVRARVRAMLRARVRVRALRTGSEATPSMSTRSWLTTESRVAESPLLGEGEGEGEGQGEGEGGWPPSRVSPLLQPSPRCLAIASN